MVNSWGTLGQQSIGHGGKVRGRRVQSIVFYRAREWRPPDKHVPNARWHPHLAAMAGRWGILGQQSIGHGDKVWGRSVQSDVFYRARGWRPAINTRQMRGGTPTSPPWPIDGALWDSNLFAMAAKCGAQVTKGTCFIACADGVPPINTCQMRGSTLALPPWPIAWGLWDSNLSAMAAKCGTEVPKVVCFTTRTEARSP